MSSEDSHDDFPSEPPPKESVRSRLESIIPEMLKRAVEIGVEKARESPDNLKQFVQDLKVPKEIAHLLFQQIDDTKSGVFRVVAKEMRDFLEHTNFSGEVQKLLTTVQFEINTTIRFTPNDGRKSTDDDDDGQEPSRQPLPKPEVKTSVRVHRDAPASREPKRPGSRSDT